MNLDEIKKEADKDLSIDKTNLDYEATVIPQQHNKYLCILFDEKLILSKYETDLSKLKRDKWLYYSGKMSEERLAELNWEAFELSLIRQDLDKFIESDNDICQLNLKIEYQKEKVNYIEGIVKAISNKMWSVRAAIDWIKFTQGV
jgi:hypothetical protein